MADTFTPRGAPVPANSYDGWELTNRPAMLPFLAEYTNALGEKSGGWAMPSMVTEPVNALFRLMNTPAGTMPDPRDPQNQSDALTGLMALYGGNAVGGVARNAMSRGVAMGRPNMEAARPVAYSNAIDEAMSNPNMLRMMDDIDYANLNRRALDQYGVGYEGLSSSQEAKLRGWSDPAFWSDTGKPNPVGAGVASKSNPLDDIDLEALLAEVKGVKNIPEPEVKGSRGAQGVQKQNADAMGFDTEKVWYRGMRRPYEDNWPEQGYNYQMFTDNFKDAGGYAGEWHQPNIMPVHVKPGNALELNAGGSNFNFVSTEGLPQEIRSKLGGTASIDQIAHAAKDAGYDSLTVNNVFDKPGEARTGKPNAVHVALKPQNIRSVNAAFDPAKADSSFLLASDTGRPNPLGAALTSDNQENSLMDLLKKYGIR